MKTYVDFDVIDVVDGGVSYPTLLGVGSANDSLELIKFKNSVMNF